MRFFLSVTFRPTITMPFVVPLVMLILFVAVIITFPIPLVVVLWRC